MIYKVHYVMRGCKINESIYEDLINDFEIFDNLKIAKDFYELMITELSENLVTQENLFLNALEPFISITLYELEFDNHMLKFRLGDLKTSKIILHSTYKREYSIKQINVKDLI